MVATQDAQHADDSGGREQRGRDAPRASELCPSDCKEDTHESVRAGHSGVGEGRSIWPTLIDCQLQPLRPVCRPDRAQREEGRQEAAKGEHCGRVCTNHQPLGGGVGKAEGWRRAQHR
eukprot:scaffold129096_cov23-Tisochrysis_lutea.AAC.1